MYTKLSVIYWIQWLCGLKNLNDASQNCPICCGPENVQAYEFPVKNFDDGICNQTYERPSHQNTNSTSHASAYISTSLVQSMALYYKRSMKEPMTVYLNRYAELWDRIVKSAWIHFRLHLIWRHKPHYIQMIPINNVYKPLFVTLVFRAFNFIYLLVAVLDLLDWWYTSSLLCGFRSQL